MVSSMTSSCSSSTSVTLGEKGSSAALAVATLPIVHTYGGNIRYTVVQNIKINKTKAIRQKSIAYSLTQNIVPTSTTGVPMKVFIRPLIKH
jgi:hypothetical protein